ncbi:FkbM family methyltransferase [Candidatus Pelagibacter sp.]|jgi:FkbM family methyltransferase|nr:FkbM family methyltransferase [Candidatus Pelagibacter sp.]|tara:strand:+ start:218 stop:991 length:774 start_codon:yes stop_codon:yes gene_type:complete
MISKLIKFPVLKRLIPSLSIRILRLLKKNRGYFTVKNTQMFLDFLDPIDREMILYQEFEVLEFNFLIKQINENKINYFLDVGANCGYYSINISKKKSGINVLAFEPNEEAYFKFSKTLEKNPYLSKKIDLKKFGLSNKDSRLLMQSKIKFGYSQTGGSSVINKNKIDNGSTFFADFKIGDENIEITNQKIAIKIDVEGHEFNVLQGIKKILQKNKCIILIEIFDINFESVNNFLSSFGYKLFYDLKKRSNYFYKNFN